MHEWYEKAHVNPRTDEYAHFKYQNSANFSKVLRLNLPEEYAK